MEGLKVNDAKPPPPPAVKATTTVAARVRPWLEEQDGPEKLDKDLEEFFRLDRNGDNYISFSEYKHMWVEPKVDKSKGGGSASEILSWRDWIPDPDQAFESARTFTAESPYAVLSGIGITTAAVYVGGMVARFW